MGIEPKISFFDFNVQEIAEEACDLIDVEYEPLPGVFDPFEAMKEGAPLVHEDRPGNICVGYHWSFGDVEKAFAESYLVREDTFQPPVWAKVMLNHRRSLPPGLTLLT